MFHIVLVSY